MKQPLIQYWDETTNQYQHREMTEQEFAVYEQEQQNARPLELTPE